MPSEQDRQLELGPTEADRASEHANCSAVTCGNPAGDVLGSNIWVGERMFYGTLVGATPYMLTKSGGFIGIPEIVKKEVATALLEHADKAAEANQGASQLQRLLLIVPIATIRPDRSDRHGRVRVAP